MIRCNNCYSVYGDDSELEIIEDMRACGKCKTDEYLMDVGEESFAMKLNDFIDKNGTNVLASDGEMNRENTIMWEFKVGETKYELHLLTK